MWDYITGDNRIEPGYELWLRRIIGVLWIVAIPSMILISSRVLWPIGSDAGGCVSFRPPASAYGVVWAMLITSLVASWIIFSRTETSTSTWVFVACMFFVIVSIASSWPYFYKHKTRQDAITVFVVLIMAIVVLVPTLWQTNVFSTGLLLPLLVWAAFQLTVSIEETKC